MSWTDQTCFRLAEGVSFQSMGPGAETVLLSLESGYLFTCNETTEAFLSAVDGRRTFGEIVSQLSSEYEVSPDCLREDMKTLVEQLLKEKLFVVCPMDEK